MPRFVIPLLAGFAAIALILAGIFGGATVSQPARVAAQASTPTATTGAASGQMLPAQLQFLSSMTPQERFDHFRGGQMSWVNPQGQTVVLDIIPGKVTAVTANTVTIQPNGATTARTFNITTNTAVRGKAQPGSLVAFSQGDRVIVTAIGNSNDAISITTRNFTETGAYGHMPGHGMKPTPAGSTTAPATPAATPTP